MSQSDKYILDETDTITMDDGTILNRVVANKNFSFQYMGKDFPTFHVQKGDKGGYIESPVNLSQAGKAWIDKNSVVTGTAYVSDHALVRNSTLEDNAQVSGRSYVTNSNLSDYAHITGSSNVYGAKLSDADLIEDSFYKAPVPEETNVSIGKENALLSSGTESFKIIYEAQPTIAIKIERDSGSSEYIECGKITHKGDEQSNVRLNHSVLELSGFYKENKEAANRELSGLIRDYFHKRYDREGGIPERIVTEWQDTSHKSPKPFVAAILGDDLTHLPYTRDEIEDSSDRYPLLQSEEDTKLFHSYDLRGFSNPSFMIVGPSGDQGTKAQYVTMLVQAENNSDLSKIKIRPAPDGTTPHRLNVIFGTQSPNGGGEANLGHIKDYPDMKSLLAQSGTNSTITFIGNDLTQKNLRSLYKAIGSPVNEIIVSSEKSFEEIRKYASKGNPPLAKNIHTGYGQNPVNWNELTNENPKNEKENSLQFNLF